MAIRKRSSQNVNSCHIVDTPIGLPFGGKGWGKGVSVSLPIIQYVLWHPHTFFGPQSQNSTTVPGPDIILKAESRRLEASLMFSDAVSEQNTA